MKPASNVQRRIADRLLTAGVISAAHHAAALGIVGTYGGRMEDALLDLGLVTEADLLKGISTLYETRFVSTQKLFQAQIEPRILQMVPKKLAELYSVFPVIFDAENVVLTVATADPDNVIAFQEVKLAARARDVRPIVARPAAIAAAIARTYKNDPQPFLDLMAGKNPRMPAVQQAASPAPPPVAAPPPKRAISLVTPATDVEIERPAAAFGSTARGAQEIVIQESAERRSEPPPARGASRASSTSEAGKGGLLSRDYLETVTVLVSLLENGRQDLRGHSAGVARLAQKICDRIGLPPEHGKAVALAAHIHDLGKAGAYHLTALNVAEYDGHKTAAEKVYSVPLHVLASVDLPTETRAAVSSMYERFDGKGLPSGSSGKDIPISARVLAVADSYSDLTQNPRNPARKILSPAEACETLGKHKGTIFDPTIVDLISHVVTGDDLRAKLLSDRKTVLIVDPDPEETTVLELRLVEQGFEVRLARSLQQAIHELQSHEIAGVISEVDLDVTDDGLALRGRALSEPWGRDAVWVVHTKKNDRELAQIVFDLGVDDFISKNTGADLLVTKLKQMIDKKKKSAAPRGVSGSLAEMAIPDMVQILFHGRKTCALRIVAKAGLGEICFAEGQVVDARFGAARGEEAFYKMLSLRDGDFQIDPNAQPAQRTIEVSPEALLLEGMRRMDEGLVG